MAGATPSPSPSPNSAGSKKLGPRISVLVGQIKKKKGTTTVNINVYSYMAKKTADLFGFTAAPRVTSNSSTTRSSGRGARAAVEGRGSKGAGSIKVPIVSGSGASAKTKFVSIPMPSGSTITLTKAFLQKATKNKPTSFVSKNGRTYPITGSTGRAAPK